MTDREPFSMKQAGGQSGPAPICIKKVCSKDQLSPLHIHETVQINYVMRGRLICRIDNKPQELVKGDAVLTPPGALHQIFAGSSNEFEMIEINFTSEFISDRCGRSPQNSFDDVDSCLETLACQSDGLQPRISLSGKKQLEVEELLEELYTEYTGSEEGCCLTMRADLVRLLVFLNRRLCENGKSNAGSNLFDYQKESIIHSLQYIQQHYTEAVSVEKVARIAMISPSYYSHLFKIVTQKTFVEYVNILRIQKAMDMLKDTDSQVLDICFECGFKNVNHFNRTFKGMVGVPPTKYRKSHQEKTGSLFVLNTSPMRTAI